jgi:glycosyltransferase involved in cell wall biosynthesis
MPRLSVVVPAYNEEKLILPTLQAIRAALAEFDARGWDAEVIVCDNNSTDQTAELARRAGAIVVFEPVNQIARARNRGAAAATGDWLLFVDADSRPSSALFADVAERISRGDCLGGGATVRLDEFHLGGWLLTGLWNFTSRTRRLLAGSFIFCQAAAFRALGGFCDKLYAAEELEFSERLKALGRRQGKRVVILSRHPLLTSARKLRLYSKREYLRFLSTMARTRGAALTDRAACHPWYDGRR